MHYNRCRPPLQSLLSLLTWHSDTANVHPSIPLPPPCSFQDLQLASSFVLFFNQTPKILSPSFLLRPFLKLVFLTFIYLLCEGVWEIWCPSFIFNNGRVEEEEMTSHFSPSPPEGMVLRSWEWENWHCPSPAAELQREDPAPHPGSTIELNLLVGAQVSWPGGMRTRGLTLPPPSAMW